MPQTSSWTRRQLVGVATGLAAGGLALAVLRAQQPLALRFLTIPDPVGWHESLRLEGDWLVFESPDVAVTKASPGLTTLVA
jgi:hypothetical protein